MLACEDEASMYAGYWSRTLWLTRFRMLDIIKRASIYSAYQPCISASIQTSLFSSRPKYATTTRQWITPLTPIHPSPWLSLPYSLDCYIYTISISGYLIQIPQILLEVQWEEFFFLEKDFLKIQALFSLGIWKSSLSIWIWNSSIGYCLGRFKIQLENRKQSRIW